MIIVAWTGNVEGHGEKDADVFLRAYADQSAIDVDGRSCRVVSFELQPVGPDVTFVATVEEVSC